MNLVYIVVIQTKGERKMKAQTKFTFTYQGLETSFIAPDHFDNAKAIEFINRKFSGYKNLRKETFYK